MPPSDRGYIDHVAPDPGSDRYIAETRGQIMTIKGNPSSQQAVSMTEVRGRTAFADTHGMPRTSQPPQDRTLGSEAKMIDQQAVSRLRNYPALTVVVPA